VDDLPDASPAVQSAIITAILRNIWKARNGGFFRSFFAAAKVTVWLIVSDPSFSLCVCDSYVLQMWANPL
jgi:hypothetical protein